MFIQKTLLVGLTLSLTACALFPPAPTRFVDSNNTLHSTAYPHQAFQVDPSFEYIGEVNNWEQFDYFADTGRGEANEKSFIFVKKGHHNLADRALVFRFTKLDRKTVLMNDNFDAKYSLRPGKADIGNYKMASTIEAYSPDSTHYENQYIESKGYILATCEVGYGLQKGLGNRRYELLIWYSEAEPCDSDIDYRDKSYLDAFEQRALESFSPRSLTSSTGKGA